MILNKMTVDDWFAFGGAEFFKDGSDPLIAYFGNTDVTLLDDTGLNVCFGGSELEWFRLECTKELGILIAEDFLSSDYRLTKERLIELGFEDIM